MAGAKARRHCVCSRGVLVIVVGLFPSCTAQEAGSVDLTHIIPRMDLRRPPLQPGDPTQRGGAIEHHADCVGSKQELMVQTTLVGLDRREYAIGDEPKFEVRVTNVGSSALRIPVSPHLADMQPPNASTKFAYSKLTIELYVGGKTWSSNHRRRSISVRG
jgi:hypothetical protein